MNKMLRVNDEWYTIDELKELVYILERQPDNYDAYYDLGKIYFDFGNEDKECLEYDVTSTNNVSYIDSNCEKQI